MTRMERKRQRQRQIRRRVALILMVVVFTVVAVVATAVKVNAAEEQTLPAQVAQPEMTVEPVQLVYEMQAPLSELEPETTDEEILEDPDESEKIQQALLDQGYLHEEIPLDYDLQCHLIAVCEEYGVPYHIALGVIQAESSFMADVSNGTCFGYMQIHKINAGWLSEEIGVTDLADPYQNLRSGVYILSDLFADYGDWHKTLIAYNYGPGGAQEHVFSKGYTTTGYSRTVMEYADAWLEVVGE